VLFGQLVQTLHCPDEFLMFSFDEPRPNLILWFTKHAALGPSLFAIAKKLVSVSITYLDKISLIAWILQIFRKNQFIPSPQHTHQTIEGLHNAI